MGAIGIREVEGTYQT